jgi:hypothetical protein
LQKKGFNTMLSEVAEMQADDNLCNIEHMASSSHWAEMCNLISIFAVMRD